MNTHSDKRRLSQKYDDVRQRNALQDRLLTHSIGKKHGLEDTKMKNVRSVENEIRSLRREYENMKAGSIPTRKFSHGEVAVRCRKISEPVKSFRLENKPNKYTKSSELEIGADGIKVLDIGMRYSADGFDVNKNKDNRWTNVNELKDVESSGKKATGISEELLQNTIDTKAGIMIYSDKKGNDEKTPLRARGNVINQLLLGRQDQTLVNSPRLYYIDENKNAKQNIEFVEEKNITFKAAKNTPSGYSIDTRQNVNLSPGITRHSAHNKLTEGSSIIESNINSHFIPGNSETSSKKIEEKLNKSDSRLSNSDNKVSRSFQLGSSADLIAMAATNSNFMRSVSIDTTSDIVSSVGETGSEVPDGAKSSISRRGSINKIKVSDLLRPAKFDREKFNPDGSIRTLHKLPDFNKSYEQARRARYIRSKELLEKEKELTTKEIFQSTRDVKESTQASS